jgi:hypothetical protein
MWVPRLLVLLPLAVLTACGGKSVQTIGGEAGSGSTCEATTCGDDCVDTSSDPRNCGGCGRNCRSGTHCENGECVSEPGCGAGFSQCGGQCVDLGSDQYNCGACGQACDFGGTCVAGICMPRCPSGICGGRCVDLVNDPVNCGGCGITCQPGQSCQGGICSGFCDGQAICGDFCVDLSSDPNNCGGCGIVCPQPAYTCFGGLCQSTCPVDTLYCSGVCVDWRSDPNNCGGCGSRCMNGQQCSNGACVNPCPEGTFCNGQCVDLGSDSANCGRCGLACGTNQVCTNGACVNFCPSGTFCGGECVDLGSNPNHCGRCGLACGMGASCLNGMCVMGACGDRIVEPGEEGDPPPGPLMSVVPLDPRTCRYDFSRISQWYCHGTCGNWGGANGCDQGDANAFCKLKMDNPSSTALSFSVVDAMQAPGVCCPPPSFATGTLGCTSVGVLSSRGVQLAVSVHPTNLFSTHQGGKVITNLVCTDP